MRRCTLITVVVISLLGSTAALAAPLAPPKKQLAISMKVVLRDSSGNDQPGPVDEILTRPQIIIQEGCQATFFVGQEAKVVSRPPRMRSIDAGIGLVVTPGKVRNGTVPVSIEVTYTTLGPPKDGIWTAQINRKTATLTFKLGEVAKVRWGSHAPNKHLWMEVVVNQVN